MATVRDMTSDANPSTGEAPTGPVARLDPDMLTGLHERIQREVDAGRLPTAQLAIGLDGDVVHTRDFGSSTPGIGYRPATGRSARESAHASVVSSHSSN